MGVTYLKEDTIERDIDKVIKLAKEKNKKIDVKKVSKAYNYAKLKHRQSEEKVRGTLHNTSSSGGIHFSGARA